MTLALRIAYIVVAFAAAFAVMMILIDTAGAQVSSTTVCNYPKVNMQGAAKADIAISNTAVTVLTTDANRCSALLSNVGSGDIRCASDNDLTPTATTGLLIKSSATLTIGKGEATRLWRCIRTTTTDSTLNVMEVATR